MTIAMFNRTRGTTFNVRCTPAEPCCTASCVRCGAAYRAQEKQVDAMTKCVEGQVGTVE